MELFGVQGRPFESRREGGDKVNEQTPVGWLMEQVSSPFSGKRTDGATDAPESDAYPDADLVIMPEEAEGFAMWGGKKHNTYVKISYGESVFRTHIVSNSDEPTWKNLFRVPFSSNKDLLVQVYHRMENAEDSLLGSIVVHRSSLKRKVGEGQWYDLNVPEEASATSPFIRWPRIKLNYSISAVRSNTASLLPSSGPVEPLRTPRMDQVPVTTRLRLPDEPPRNLFLAQIDTAKPLPSPPQQARNGNSNRSNAGDQSAFSAQLRGSGANSLPVVQVDKPTPPYSSGLTNSGAVVKSNFLGPQSPRTPSAPLSQGRVKGPDSAEGSGNFSGEYSEAPASGPRTVSSQNSDRGSDNSREGTAWPQPASSEASVWFGGGLPDQPHASPRPANASSPSKRSTWTPRSLVENEEDRRSSGGSASSSTRPTSFPRVLSVKPLAKTPESEFVRSPSAPQLPGHSGWHSESNLNARAQYSPRTERASLSPRPGSARVSPRPGSGSATPKVLAAQAAPISVVQAPAQATHLDLGKLQAAANAAQTHAPGDRDETGSGGPMETDRDGMRLALVKLAELLAKRGNMEGSAHAMRRAAMLHWQSTGSDLDIVSC